MPKYAKLKRNVERKAKEGIKIYIDHQWREFDLYEDILDHVRYFFIDYISALLRARVFYDMEFCNSEKVWSEIIKRCMREDFSWERSAREYESAYTTARVLRFYDS
jgi:hypothetical protein